MDEQTQYKQFEDTFYQGTEWQEAHQNNDQVEQVPSDVSEEGYHQEHDESVEAHFCSSPSTISITCRLCKGTFSSGNQLHKHLKSCLQEATARKSLAEEVEAFIAAND